MRKFKLIIARGTLALAGITSVLAGASTAYASDHLDTPSVIADPRADIGDIFAWTSPDRRRLNLVMAIVGHSFSDKLDYVFHIDSGPSFGKSRATTSIRCRFNASNSIDCRVGEADQALGDPSGPNGLEGKSRKFRVFAGLRDDPFFNNVKGSRAAFDHAAAALRSGTVTGAAGCPRFDAATSSSILDRWRHVDGGPAQDLLKGWTPATLVISVDLDVVSAGGKMLAVWGETSSSRGRVDRAGRPLTGNALLGGLATAEESNRLKEQYNAATPSEAASFIPEIEKGLALYDGYDGNCGNQWLVDQGTQPRHRYRTLAALLADDRLWVNSASGVCTQLLAVELASRSRKRSLKRDCGGRTPNYDAVDSYRSLLVNGTLFGVSDGVDRDARDHDIATFPFLAAPAGTGAY